MKIGYICTNFRSASFTLKAVRSLVANRGHEIRSVVVDNCSGGEDLRILSQLGEEFPEMVHVVASSENLGYFGGLNLGIKYLRERCGDLDAVVIGNNDLLFAEDFVDSLVRCESLLRNYAVISPDVVTLDGVHQNPHVIESISKAREVLYSIYYSNYYVARVLKWIANTTRPLSNRKDELHWRVPRCIHQGHGSCYILSPIFFRHFDLLWAPSFLMGEEYFLSKQLKDVGHQVYYEPAISVLHCCHATISGVPARQMWVHSREAHRVYRRHVKIWP